MTATQQSYLLVMWEGGGTVPPELGVARRLISAGHDVHVLGDPTIAERAKRAGCGFTAWTTAPHRTSLSPDNDIFRDWETKNPVSMLRNAIDRFMAGPAAQFAADTAEVIAAVGPDAVLVDGMILGAMIAVRGAGLPLVVLMPNIWMVPTKGVTAVGPGFAPAKTALGRLRDATMRALGTRIFDKGLPALNAASAAHGVAPSKDLWDLVRDADRALVLTSAHFDFAAGHVPDNVRYVGPVLDEPMWAEPWRSPWPSDHPDPLVVVGLSSTFQDQVPLLRRIVTALEELPVRAVVTLGQMVDPGEVSTDAPNVLVVPSAPHGALLPTASLMVTHCGHGSTMKALAAGVPLLCVPMGRDQNDTAARVVHAGAGVRISNKASSNKIASAITRVLADDAPRAGAAAMAKAIADELTSNDLVAELEAVAARAATLSATRAAG